MKTIITFTILICFNISLAQTKITEVKYIVNDNKKSLVDTIYNYYDSNGKLIEQRFNVDEPVNKTVYSYDSQNRLIEEKLYKYSSLKNTYKYEYDKSGKLVKEKCYDGNGNIVFSNSLKYDDKNRLTKKKSNISTRFSISYYYDGNNNCFKTEISGNSSMKKEIECFYDEKGNIIQETVYQSLKKSKDNKRYQVSKIKFVYDESGKLSQKINYITDEVIENFYYTYNDDGTLSKWEKFNAQNKLAYLVEYVYEK